jgi:hypothetical protein
MFAARTLSAVILAGAVLTAPAAHAAEATSAPAATVQPPSPAAVGAADQLLIAMGVKESIAKTVPAMMTEFEQNVTTTRPEIRDSLRETLVAIKPEFDKSAQLTYAKSEALLALAMNEKDLEDVAAFFNSPAGKKYLAIQPLFFQRLEDLLAPWRQELSTNIVTKARAEMKKKGIDF